jgi:hypothetical protein
MAKVTSLSSTWALFTIICAQIRLQVYPSTAITSGWPTIRLLPVFRFPQRRFWTPRQGANIDLYLPIVRGLLQLEFVVPDTDTSKESAYFVLVDYFRFPVTRDESGTVKS